MMLRGSFILIRRRFSPSLPKRSKLHTPRDFFGPEHTGPISVLQKTQQHSQS